MRLILPILYNTDETTKKDEIGVDIKVSEYIIRDMIFYQISSVGQYVENGIVMDNYSQIYSNGISFYCALSVNEVDKLITKSMLIYAE
jgi:hypothetical protein